VGGVSDDEESRLDFSASALIRCEMPEETLIFLTGAVESGSGSPLLWMLQGPEDFLDNCVGDMRPTLPYVCETDLFSGELTLGWIGATGDLETDIGFASSTFAF
jgi:hypothetical protein